jgi:photosystem II stability/assembly factor-like uncharacterized protein
MPGDPSQKRAHTLNVPWIALVAALLALATAGERAPAYGQAGRSGLAPLPNSLAQAGVWTRLVRPAPGQTLRAVFFADHTHGWAVGGESELDCIILRTSDGTNWSLLSCPVRHRLAAVAFTDVSNGWVVGDSGTILHTADGGDSWRGEDAGTSDGITSVKAIDANRAYVTVRSGGILRTTDGGDHWQPQVTGTPAGLFDLDFVDANNGWAVGSGGQLIRTEDGGVTWHGQPFGVDVRLYSVDFVDGNRGWIAGNGIWRSDDGGWSWSSAAGRDVVSKSVEDLYAVDAETAWAVGDEGMILHTADGTNWSREAQGLTNKGMRGVFFVDRDLGYVVGNEGLIFRYGVPAPTATRTPTPTNTPTPTRTPRPTPTATSTPSSPWVSAGDSRPVLLLAPGSRARVLVSYGSIAPPVTLVATLTGPLVFPASGASRLDVPIERASGALAVDIAAAVSATPGTPFTLEARMGTAHATRRGVVAYRVLLPAVRRQ